MPTSTEAQTMARSSEEFTLRAEEIVVAVDKTGPETKARVAELSFESSKAVTRPASLGPTTLARGWFERVADREVPRLKLSTGFADSGSLAVAQQGPQKRSWIGRHPVLFGTVVGFGGGFLIGYVPGDDGVFDDFTAGFNGWVLGGVGAGTGAAVGAVVGALTK